MNNITLDPFFFGKPQKKVTKKREPSKNKFGDLYYNQYGEILSILVNASLYDIDIKINELMKNGFSKKNFKIIKRK